MSDIMQGQPMPGGMGGGMGGGPIKDNLSAFNPTDMAFMKGQGNIDPNMKVSDYLRQVGIDPEGPLTQLAEFGRKQVENGNPLGKMKNIAGGAPGGAPGGMPGGAPPMPKGNAGGGGMEELLNSL